jgi:hypothetical protein
VKNEQKKHRGINGVKTKEKEEELGKIKKKKVK